MDSQSSPQFQVVDSYSFALSFFVPRAQKNRRQAAVSGFVGQGQAVNTCASAVIYTLVNGQLFANSSSGATQFGTSSGTVYANFTPSVSPGNITTVFSVDYANNLMWNNNIFYNNFARFCVLPDNSIVAVFVSPDQAPAGCLFVTLSMIRLSSCVQNPAYITGPSGPSGLSGASGPSGPVGPTGISGAQGISGVPGVSGQIGVSGAVGATGPQGVSGPTGPQGNQGPVGATGPTGPAGLSGAVGATGVQGPAGPQGVQGPTGPSGIAGASGVTGAQGPQGPAGPQGVQGPTGLSGQIGLSVSEAQWTIYLRSRLTS